MADLFISYLRPDWSVAARIAEAVERTGYTVSWDFPSWHSESLIDAIDRERSGAKAVLVLWSRAGLASARLKVEALAAHREGRLIQARIDRVEAPGPFRALPMADLVGWNGDLEADGWRVLRGLLARALEEPGSPSALGLGWSAWQFPARARARQLALCTLPFLALPIAVTGAKSLSGAVNGSGMVSAAARLPKAEEPLDMATLVDALGVCDEAPVERGEAAPKTRPVSDPRSLSDLTFDAIRGDTEAQYHLALRLIQGDGVTVNETRGLAWLERAAEADHAKAQLELGSLYLTESVMPPDPVRAAAWFVKAAIQGDKNAQYNLGVLLMRGDGIAQDRAAAREWFEKAAAQGVLEAAFNLGVLYANGWGGAPDHARATVLLERVAQTGRADAAWSLGMLLYEGDESVRDKDAAVRWFRMAARDNHANAQYIMSILHLKGEGVPQSQLLASVWLDLAIANGSDQKALREELRAAMTGWEAEAALEAFSRAATCLGVGEGALEEPEAQADLIS